MNIQGLNKAEVLAALYNHANLTAAQHFKEEESPVMEKEDAEELLQYLKEQDEEFVDYINGRPIKVFIFRDVIDTWMYNRDNGDGAAEKIINAIR